MIKAYWIKVHCINRMRSVEEYIFKIIIAIQLKNCYATASENTEGQSFCYLFYMAA
jgi:hypothetical protein